MSSKSNGLKNVAQFFIDIYWKRESLQVIWSFQGMRKAWALEKITVFPYNMNNDLYSEALNLMYTYMCVHVYKPRNIMNIQCDNFPIYSSISKFV